MRDSIPAGERLALTLRDLATGEHPINIRGVTIKYTLRPCPRAQLSLCMGCHTSGIKVCVYMYVLSSSSHVPVFVHFEVISHRQGQPSHLLYEGVNSILRLRRGSILSFLHACCLPFCLPYYRAFKRMRL